MTPRGLGTRRPAAAWPASLAGRARQREAICHPCCLTEACALRGFPANRPLADAPGSGGFAATLSDRALISRRSIDRSRAQDGAKSHRRRGTPRRPPASRRQTRNACVGAPFQRAIHAVSGIEAAGPHSAASSRAFTTWVKRRYIRRTPRAFLFVPRSGPDDAPCLDR